ncbi:MAG: DUF305 domain-containing protein, partial [Synechococcaceae bacterium WB9_4xC_028]|nr:DUF305 domain-containing protein [Synechococcaceae bacterium WB9_4xC_028]
MRHLFALAAAAALLSPPVLAQSGHEHHHHNHGEHTTPMPASGDHSRHGHD